MRPKLIKNISIEEFKRNYWLKEELVSFCRENQLPISGGKIEVARRIEEYLLNAKVDHKENIKKYSITKSSMPRSFTRKTIIGKGWHCSQELRFFFEKEIGRSFHFNATMREFIRNGHGKTLDDAITTYKKEKMSSRKKSEIAPQFEYNKHIREYFKNHDGATLADAIRAWNMRKEERTRG